MIVNRSSITLFRISADLVLLNAAFILAAVFAQSFDILITRNYMFILEMGLNLLWLFSSNIINFYDDLNSRYFAFQFVNILKNAAFQVLGAVLFIFLAKEDLFTRNFIVYYGLILSFFITLRYIAFRKILKALRRQGKNIRNLIIIGSGELSANFFKILNEHPDFGYSFIGFVTAQNSAGGNNILGDIKNLSAIIEANKVEEAVITLTETSPELLDEIISVCNRNAVKVHIIPDYFRYISKKFQVSMLADFPIITVRSEPLDEVQWRLIKRIFDIVFSFLVTALLLMWMLPLIGLLIKIQSPGPVLFVQERIGVRNRKFRCFKFRTMYIHNNEANKFIPADEKDPRITPLGHFLRKTNIDELPQFINVLLGDMSVVGPRPHAIKFNEKYSAIVDVIKMRHNVKPGITGWAQVHGLRGDSADESENIILIKKRIEYDLWYIENWTFGLDVQIILLTIWQMARGKSGGV